MMSTYGTQFVESELILAAQAGDAATVARLVKEMLPNERKELGMAAAQLVSILWEASGRPTDWIGQGDVLHHQVQRV
jgi:hypothetical protein